MNLIQTDEFIPAIQKMLDEHMEKVVFMVEHAAWPNLLSPGKVSTILAIHYNTVMRMVRDGELRTVKRKTGSIGIAKEDVVSILWKAQKSKT